MIIVVRAKKDIRPGSIISLDLLEEAALPDSAYDADCVKNISDAVGKVARTLIFQGRQIRRTDLDEQFKTAS